MQAHPRATTTHRSRLLDRLDRGGVDRSATAEDDIMSFILFDHNVHIAMENQKIVYNDALIDTLCNYHAGGWTQFAKAVEAAGELLKRYQKDWR